MATDDWITTAEAATLSGYHVEHLRQLIRAGKIEARKWVREWQVSKKSLHTYLNEVERLGQKRGPKSQT